jgi:hypothetical protein
MPRYFFNIRYEPDTIDEDGEELPDDKTAWKEATVIAGEMFRDIDGKLQPGQEWSLEVTDDRKRPLFKITVSAKRFEPSQ